MTGHKTLVFIVLIITGIFSCSMRDMPAEKMALQERQEDTLSWSKPEFSERREERHNMVEKEIAQNLYQPVKEKKVLEAMKSVPRHKFVPESLQEFAYENRPLPIGHGQTISQPFIVAHMTELLNIEAGDKVLEIGTGSGYQAAVLSELTPYVYTIEIIPELGQQAIHLFDKLGYHTIKTKIGDGYQGWQKYAPFDRIIVTCAPEDIPDPLVEQLKPGGKIVIPVGGQREPQYLVVVRKTEDGRIKRQRKYPVRFVPMTGESEKEN